MGSRPSGRTGTKRFLRFFSAAYLAKHTAILNVWRDQVKYQHSSTSAEIPKTGQNTRIQRGEQWDLFFFASRFDAVELRSSPRLLATAQNTNFQVRLRGLWAMADALCAES